MVAGIFLSAVLLVSSIASKAGAMAWRRIPWKLVWSAALWLAQKGQERVRENLSADEQREFWELMKKSRGKPTNLDAGDRNRMKDIAGKAMRGA